MVHLVPEDEPLLGERRNARLALKLTPRDKAAQRVGLGRSDRRNNYRPKDYRRFGNKAKVEMSRYRATSR